MQPADCVHKNSFRKVKLRETDSGLAKKSSPSSLPHTNIPLLVTQCILPNISIEKERMGQERCATSQGNWKWNSEFYKKGELEEDSIYIVLKLRGTD